MMLDTERCWQAVCERDPRQDGLFVFAVRSTGIFCRPSCPARRPLRTNVQFYADATSAEAAGFRPCRRCAPHGQSPADHLDGLIEAACQLLREQPLTLAQLSTRIGLSASHLVRAFKQRTGMTPAAWRRQQSAPARPSRERLRVAVGECSLGWLLLAADGHGLRAVLLGDSPAQLQQELHERFPRAQCEADLAGLAQWQRQLLARLDNPDSPEEPPLAAAGTAFQQRVWQALRAIPRGQTRSYAELAALLGTHPRAIARACASNPIAVLVPCHRVLGSAGALSGYRWGIARKAELLRREGALPADQP